MPKKSSRKVKHSFKKLDCLLGVFLIIFSVFLLLGLPNLLYRLVENPITVSHELTQKPQTNNIPTHLTIASVGIDLPIVEAPVVHGYWTVSDTAANHGVGSANPGDKGNIVIFAHARPGLFYNLREIQVGDKLVLLTKTGKKAYKVVHITFVLPNETRVIKPTKTETVTLYTCSGFYDEKRLVVSAIPVK